MTTALDHSSVTLRRLIDSCQETHDGFSAAAKVLGQGTLKTLFGLYAQQRSRFAEELGVCVSTVSSEIAVRRIRPSFMAAAESELLNECLERERNTLKLYREALAGRSLPTKAHFLVSAQLALIERVYSRMQALALATCGAPELSQRAIL